MQSPWKSLVAGGTAGAVEAAITYPFEFAKTRLQLENPGTRNPVVLLINTIRQQGVRTVYAGADALIIGTAWKAAVRFVGFDAIRGAFADGNGRTSKLGGVVAGLGAGILESVIAVTPFETIKTALIDDARGQRRYHGMVSATKGLVREHGLKGIYRGLLPVTMRQAGNSAVRMGSYNALKETVHPKTSLGTFAIGSLAGVITVYTTMPLDTIKTRMQSLAQAYPSTWTCARRIWREEGVLSFWRGATPRLCRLVLSGGIVFSIYERVMTLL